MHPAKRRRLDDATSTLAKPFRSPLRADVKKNTESLSLSSEHNDETTQASTKASVEQATRIEDQASTFIADSQGGHNHASTPRQQITSASPDPSQRPRQRLQARSQTYSSLSSSSPAQLDASTDSSYATLQKHHSALALQLKTLATSLDTISQALQICQESQDETELARLTGKWRDVARETAEELFDIARDRISHMGGMEAWRKDSLEREQDRRDFLTSFDNDETRIEHDSSLTGQDSHSEAIIREDETARGEYGSDDHELNSKRDDGQENGGYNETFTMEAMLKQLNIDLEVLGYDKNLEKWTD